MDRTSAAVIVTPMNERIIHAIGVIPENPPPGSEVINTGSLLRKNQVLRLGMRRPPYIRDMFLCRFDTGMSSVSEPNNKGGPTTKAKTVTIVLFLSRPANGDQSIAATLVSK